MNETTLGGARADADFQAETRRFLGEIESMTQEMQASQKRVERVQAQTKTDLKALLARLEKQ